MTLEELRKKVDGVDKELLLALQKRLSLIREIADLKKANGLPLKQPEREESLLAHKKELAKEFGVNQDLVEKIYKLLIEESLDLQKNHNGKH